MISLLICLTPVLIGAAWIFYRRRALRSLNWNPNLATFQLARNCHKYMSLHGISIINLYEIKKTGPNAQGAGPVNLRITNEQFNKKLPIFKIICRDKDMYLGETFFSDITENRSKNNDWKSLFLVLRTSPPNQLEWHLAERNCVPVLQPTELRDLAKALLMIKAGRTPIYEGSSPTLARTLKTGSIGLVTSRPN